LIVSFSGTLVNRDSTSKLTRTSFEPKINDFNNNLKLDDTLIINGENFIQNSESKILFTSIGVSFKYTFGKLNFKDPSKKSNIRNDDVQEESNGEY